MNLKRILQPSYKTYFTGFITSLVITLAAYFTVVDRLFSTHGLIAFVVGLALIQFIIQGIFFLHLGAETKPRWKLGVFLFMLLVVGILVFGSLWIMSNLNYRLTPGQVNNYLNSQDGF